MPYNDRSLVLVDSIPNATNLPGRAGMCNFFRYANQDTLAVIIAAGYFNPARDRLQVGDMIDVVGGVGAAAVTESYTFTAVPASGNVTIVVEAGTP